MQDVNYLLLSLPKLSSTSSWTLPCEQAPNRTTTTTAFAPPFGPVELGRRTRTVQTGSTHGRGEAGRGKPSSRKRAAFKSESPLLLFSLHSSQIKTSHQHVHHASELSERHHYFLDDLSPPPAVVFACSSRFTSSSTSTTKQLIQHHRCHWSIRPAALPWCR